MNQPVTPRTLLFVFAHPDDETFGCGGTMAHYAAQGHNVVLVCATRGEEGEISDPALASPERLGEVREQELRCAARALGVSDLLFLDYRDSGMAGTAQNEAAEAFIQQPAAEVVARLVDIIRRYRPEVVVTFEPQGGYGHPDHIAVHNHTVAAFHAAGQAGAAEGEPWQASRLYYSVVPRSVMQEFQRYIDMEGIADELVEQMEEAEMGWPDERVDVALDVEPHFDAKQAALECHRTQFGEEHFFRKLPADTYRSLMGQEYYALAWPQASHPNRAGLLDES